MSESKRILIFAAGIILAIGLVGLGFSIFNNSKTSINSSINQYSNLTSQYDNFTYSQYENSTAKGDEVVRLISNLDTVADGVSISVQTKASSSAVTYTAGSNTVETSISADNYINPNAVFDCSITRNENGVIVSVTFKQR